MLLTSIVHGLLRSSFEPENEEKQRVPKLMLKPCFPTNARLMLQTNFARTEGMTQISLKSFPKTRSYISIELEPLAEAKGVLVKSEFRLKIQ